MNNITRLATECPAVIKPQDFLRVTDGGSLTAGNAPVSESILTGQTGWTAPLRRNATRSDLLARYGAGGAYAVAYGLTLSAVGLSVTVAPGHALCDGVVEVPAALNVSVSDTTKWVHIWLLRNGTLNAVNISVLPPSPNAIYLGAVQTASGSVQQIDYSGVCYQRGGLIYRATNDYGAPLDTPPQGVQFLARTNTGRYYFDGDAYVPLGSVASVLAQNNDDLLERVEALEGKFQSLLLSLIDLFDDDDWLSETLAESLDTGD